MPFGGASFHQIAGEPADGERVPRVSGRTRRQTDSALPWTLSFLRPYRRAVARLVALSIGEIALRALAPWPLKAIVDFLTRGAPPVAAVPRWVVAAHPIALLGSVVAAGLLLQIGHELVLLAHTRVQARLAQRMVFDLRSRLFTHLQYLSLAHHAVGSTADSVYRLDTDAGCLESLLLKGLFPLVFSALTLVVMFGILIELDPLLALISMIVVPLLYLTLRLSMGGMFSRADRAKRLESAVVARMSREPVRDPAGEDVRARSARGPSLQRGRARRHGRTAGGHPRRVVLQLSGRSHHRRRRDPRARYRRSARAAGDAHGRHAARDRRRISDSCTGPLSAIATTAGSLHGALASARRVHEVLRLPREDRRRDARGHRTRSRRRPFRGRDPSGMGRHVPCSDR